MQRRFPKIGVIIVFTIGFIVFVVHLTRIFWVFCVFLLSAFFFPFRLLFPRTSDGKPFFICLYRTEFLTTISHTTCGILCENCFSSSRLAAFSHPLLLKLTWPRSHCLVTLLLIYSATKKVRLILHDVSSGTNCPWNFFILCGTIATPVAS